MSSRSSGSTVVRRRLGAALRVLREDANIRLEAAARELECSTAKISRLENGQGPAKTWEVRVLLGLYGVDDEATRLRFDRWAAQTKSAGWWEPDADVVDDDLARYFAVETESSLIRMYCTPVIPAILQTGDYALAHVRAWYPDLTHDETHRFAELRQVRKRELLGRDTALRLVAVLDESAVRRQVGSRQVHADMLLALADLLDDQATTGREDVTVRVLPFSAGTPDRAMCAFTLFTPHDPGLDPVTACVEDSTGATWYESEQDIAGMAAMFDRLLALCLDPERSRRFLRDTVTSDMHASPAARTASSPGEEGNGDHS